MRQCTILSLDSASPSSRQCAKRASRFCKHTAGMQTRNGCGFWYGDHNISVPSAHLFYWCSMIMMVCSSEDRRSASRDGVISPVKTTHYAKQRPSSRRRVAIRPTWYIVQQNNTFVEPTPDLPSTTNVCPLSWYIYVVHTAKQLLPNCATGCHRRGYPLKLIDIKLDKGKQRKQAVVLVVSSS